MPTEHGFYMHNVFAAIADATLSHIPTTTGSNEWPVPCDNGCWTPTQREGCSEANFTHWFHWALLYKIPPQNSADAALALLHGCAGS